MLLYTMLYIVLAYLMLFAALTNCVCLNNASFFFLFKYFLCQGYELSGEIALKNNHYYYYYYILDFFHFLLLLLFHCLLMGFQISLCTYILGGVYVLWYLTLALYVLDGDLCFITRYRGNEGLAPVTYLQKGNGHYAKHTMDKNYASGVKMASDILSNLANTSSSESSIKVVERPGMPFVERSYAKSDRDYINAGRLQSLDDKCSGKNWPVERYSSLKPSPWRSCTNVSDRVNCLFCQLSTM